MDISSSHEQYFFQFSVAQVLVRLRIRWLNNFYCPARYVTVKKWSSGNFVVRTYFSLYILLTVVKNKAELHLITILICL